MLNYQSFIKESLQGIRLTFKVGNYIDALDPEADGWFQQMTQVKEYQQFLSAVKDCDEKDIPAMIEKAKGLKLFQTAPSNVWDFSKIMNLQKVRTDKDCYLWIKDYITVMLQLYLEWASNKKSAFK